MSKPPDEAPGFFDRPDIHDRIFYGLVAACVALVAAELTYHPHPHFEHEGWFAFHAGFGFAAYVAIVTTAKGLRRLLKRSEDYYGE